MPKRKGPEPKPEEQFKEFMETARKLDVDPEKAEKAFKKLARPKAQPKRQPGGR